MSRLQFIDKTKAENLKRGIEYFAVGLVVSCHMEDGVPNPSGKDYAVEYIDPFGSYQYCWRSSAEIEVSPISDEGYLHLKMAYESATDTVILEHDSLPDDKTKREPLAYQFRTKTTNEGSVWRDWVQCSKAEYDNYKSNPGPNIHGIVREIRALSLYTSAGENGQD